MTWEQKRQESYNHLDKYKGEISEEEYERIENTIGSHAIEDMFLSEDEVYNLVRMEKGEISADELVAEYIHKLKAS
ncbi:MAG TPA: hypothetical protein PLH07_08605 [Sulfurovum sp.]|nr:MAG: hypothetical protein B7Y23_08190 [Sulfurovum sp. 16-42-52]OYZ49329.1 MAG: hypothetical protein B7Y13_05075 [Sulfurovum sp. 24-42-9]HQS77974.1 hypothetical protein [Sulfurovum sp.]HQT29342.1 hypothetical protein [Sulfurovum sp.]